MSIVVIAIQVPAVSSIEDKQYKVLTVKFSMAANCEVVGMRDLKSTEYRSSILQAATTSR